MTAPLVVHEVQVASDAQITQAATELPELLQRAPEALERAARTE